MDGTLVRTEELWMAAEERTMAAYGSHWDAQDQAVAIGGPLDRVVRYMAARVDHSEAEVGARLVAEIEELMHAEHVPWMPGARKLHDALADADVPQALVSNSWRHLMNTALQELGTRFDVSVAGDEVATPKPDPEPYLRACELLNCDPSGTVVLEDSPTGVTAGVAAGCFVVGIPHVSALPTGERVTIVESLTQVTPQFLERIVSRAD